MKKPPGRAKVASSAVNFKGVTAVTEIILREDLPHLDFSQDATGEKLPPVTPGEVLLEDFLDPSACPAASSHLNLASRRSA
jgi:hypothetical protein